MSSALGEIGNGGRTPASVRARLAAMMFLQYFVQGAYLPVASLYLRDHLEFTDWEIGVFSSAIAFGALLAPVISGQVADRYMRTEHFLALSHFLGGLLMLLIAWQTEAKLLLVLAILYSVLYVPTISLTNTMCFRNLADREREFPPLRMFGTIGFIMAQWPFEFVVLSPLKDAGPALDEARGIGFVLSGVAGIFLAGYCLTLPRTPPVPKGAAQFAPSEAFRLLRNRGFLVVFLISLPIAIVHQYHFAFNGLYLQDIGIAEDWVGRVSSVGQIFEIAVVASLGWILQRLGFKWTMCLGIAAYVLRNLIFAAQPPLPIVVLAQGLHGFCFACFFAVAFMYVDRLAPTDARASVQTFFNIFALGVGAVLGGWIAGVVADLFHNPQTGSTDYFSFWSTAAAISLASLIFFAVAFPRRPFEEKPNSEM